MKKKLIISALSIGMILSSGTVFTNYSYATSTNIVKNIEYQMQKYDYKVKLRVTLDENNNIIKVEDNDTISGINGEDARKNRLYWQDFIDGDGLLDYAGKNIDTYKDVDIVSGATYSSNTVKSAISTIFGIDPEKENINKLTKIVAEAKEFYNSMIEGDEVGNYPKGYKAYLLKYINAAETALAEKDAQSIASYTTRLPSKMRKVKSKAIKPASDEKINQLKEAIANAKKFVKDSNIIEADEPGKYQKGATKFCQDFIDDAEKVLAKNTVNATSVDDSIYYLKKYVSKKYLDQFKFADNIPFEDVTAKNTVNNIPITVSGKVQNGTIKFYKFKKSKYIARVESLAKKYSGEKYEATKAIFIVDNEEDSLLATNEKNVSVTFDVGNEFNGRKFKLVRTAYSGKKVYNTYEAVAKNGKLVFDCENLGGMALVLLKEETKVENPTDTTTKSNTEIKVKPETPNKKNTKVTTKTPKEQNIKVTPKTNTNTKVTNKTSKEQNIKSTSKKVKTSNISKAISKNKAKDNKIKAKDKSGNTSFTNKTLTTKVNSNNNAKINETPNTSDTNNISLLFASLSIALGSLISLFKRRND